MKRGLFLLLIILVSLAAAAQEEDYNTYSFVKTKVELSSGLSLVKGQNPSIEYLMANTSLYPKNSFYSDVLSLDAKSQPQAEITREGNSIIYLWRNLEDRESFGFSADIKNKNVIVPVTEKIRFPLQDIDPSLLPYTRASRFIDINKEIVNKANEIVAGDDDLYSVVFKLADWTRNNVNYNLSTLTAEVTQKSSWVFENRQGVCKELTSLFISFLRSVGIPARFISGSAYTNLGYKWGNHGWAEVYFPGYGWIPFDVTYGEYGWVDPSHIKLSSTADSTDPSIKYSWVANNIDINPGQIDLNVSLLDKGERTAPFARISATPLINNVGPGSYAPIKVSVENLQAFYLPATLQVTKAPNLTEQNVKSILLKPRQQKSAYWIVKVPGDLKSGFEYSTLFEVKDFSGASDTAKINFAVNGKVITLDDAKSMIVPEQEEKTYSRNLAMECSSRNYYYSYEGSAVIVCDLKNIGNAVVNGVSVCLGSNCQTANMDIAEAKKIKFNVSLINLSNAISISATSDGSVIYRYLNLNVIENPNLRITNVVYPEQVPYNQNTNMSLILNTDAPVYNINVNINGQEFNIDKIENIEKINFEMNSKQLMNKNKIKLGYEDENKKKYELKDVFYANLTNVPWYVKIINLFKEIF